MPLSADLWERVEVSPPHDVDLAALQVISSSLSATLASIEDDHHALATPCADWDLSALVDHVTGGNWFTIRVLNGRSSDDAMNETLARFEGTNASREQAISSVAEQLTAFRHAGILDQTHDHAAGELTGRQMLRLRLHDLIIHNWDLDQTLAPPASIPTDLARWGLAELAGDDSLMVKHFDVDRASMLDGSEGIEAAYRHHFGRR